MAFFREPFTWHREVKFFAHRDHQEPFQLSFDNTLTSTVRNRPFFDLLPPELIFAILDYIDTDRDRSTIVALVRTCRFFYRTLIHHLYHTLYLGSLKDFHGRYCHTVASTRGHTGCESYVNTVTIMPCWTPCNASEFAFSKVEFIPLNQVVESIRPNQITKLNIAFPDLVFTIDQQFIYLRAWCDWNDRSLREVTIVVAQPSQKVLPPLEQLVKMQSLQALSTVRTLSVTANQNVCGDFENYVQRLCAFKLACLRLEQKRHQSTMTYQPLLLNALRGQSYLRTLELASILLPGSRFFKDLHYMPGLQGLTLSECCVYLPPGDALLSDEDWVEHQETYPMQQLKKLVVAKCKGSLRFWLAVARLSGVKDLHIPSIGYSKTN